MTVYIKKIVISIFCMIKKMICLMCICCKKIVRNAKNNNKIKHEATDLLFKAILSLNNEEECYNFFEDLCTVPELKAMSQRIVVAKMLTDKKVYSDIVAKTGASTATISRVNRSLIYGSDGYEMVFGRIFDEKEDKVGDK